MLYCNIGDTHEVVPAKHQDGLAAGAVRAGDPVCAVVRAFPLHRRAGRALDIPDAVRSSPVASCRRRGKPGATAAGKPRQRPDLARPRSSDLARFAPCCRSPAPWWSRHRRSCCCPTRLVSLSRHRSRAHSPRAQRDRHSSPAPLPFPDVDRRRREESTARSRSFPGDTAKSVRRVCGGFRKPDNENPVRAIFFLPPAQAGWP